MMCPFTKQQCREDECGLYYSQAERCAIVDLAVSGREISFILNEIKEVLETYGIEPIRF